MEGGYSLNLPAGAIPISLLREAMEFFEERRANARGEAPRTAEELAEADLDGEEGWLNREFPSDREIEFAREEDNFSIQITWVGRNGRSWTRQRDGSWTTNHGRPQADSN